MAVRRRQSPFCVFPLALCAAFIIAQALAFDVRFDGHAVLSCESGDEASAHLMSEQAKKDDLDVWSHSIKPGRALHVMVPADKRAYWESQYGCTPMIEDVQEVIDQQFSHAAMIRGLQNQGVEVLMGENEGAADWYSQYHRFDEIVRKTKALADKHKDNTKFVASIGKTHEGREIPVIHLSGSGGGKNKPQIWLNGGQHAREWIAPAAVVYMAENMLEDYRTGRELGESLHSGEQTAEKERLGKVKKLMDKFEFVVAPVINPDGYEYSFTGNRMWRKNRRKNDDGTYGVDLNRNWDNHWGEGGASTRTSATDYQGPSVASEPEVQACQKYIKGLKHGIAGIDFHSYGELILRSRGWTKKRSGDESLLKTVGTDMKAAIHKQRGTKYTSETAAGLYPTTGSTDDWMSEGANMWGHGWTVELPDSERGGKGFLLAASQIKPASKEMYHGVISFGENMAKQHDEREKMGAKEWTKRIHRRTYEELRHERASEDKLGESEGVTFLDY